MFFRNHDTISTRNDQIVYRHMRTLKRNNSLTAYKRYWGYEGGGESYSFCPLFCVEGEAGREVWRGGRFGGGGGGGPMGI
jgi:hypothetical protein